MDVAETLTPSPFEEPIAPDLSHLITEDDTPVDNRFSERQFRLLTIPLFESWDEGKPFEALTDVGLFYTPSNDSVIVPDFLLSLGVKPRGMSGKKEDKSYFIWLYGKPPNLVIEVVSNKIGEELDRKKDTYESIGVAYYAVHDPFQFLGKRELRLFKLEGGQYVERVDATSMPEIGLGLILWEGSFQDAEARWLRFTDKDGNLILTASEKNEDVKALAKAEAERADSEAERADSEAERADSEAKRAEAESKRADEAVRETVRAFFEAGTPMELIEKATGLTPTELEALLAEF